MRATLSHLSKQLSVRHDSEVMRRYFLLLTLLALARPALAQPHPCVGGDLFADLKRFSGPARRSEVKAGGCHEVALFVGSGGLLCDSVR